MKFLNLNEVTKKVFETTQSDLIKYNGQDFTVLRELEAGTPEDKDYEVDFECCPMVKIQFEDGFITDAFCDEVFTDETLDTIFTPEFLEKYR